MRISTGHIFNIANKSMADASEAIVKTQQQISSGKRVSRPSDDPVASTKILALNNELENITQYKNNIGVAKNNLMIEESVLTSVNYLLQSVQETAVQAGNTATLSTNEYLTLASSVDSRLDELTNLLNTQNASGDFIFGGFKSNTSPFIGNAQQGFDYVGDDGQQFIKIASGTILAATDSGKEIFVDIVGDNNSVNTYASPANRSNPAVSISMGQVVDQEAYDAFYPEDIIITFNEDNDVTPPSKNYTITERSTGRPIEPFENHSYASGEEILIHGVSFRIAGNPTSAQPGVQGDRLFVDSTRKQDVLTTLARFSEAMKTYDGTAETREALNEAVASALNNLTHAQTSVLEATSTIGARVNTLDSTEALHVDSELVTRDLLQQLQDLDYAEAATRLSSQTLILEAAQSSFVRISRLSLFSQL